MTTTPDCPPSDTPSRNSFALRGPSVALDPRAFAVRPDLADVRLADRVFAPHYAEPMAMTAIRATAILVAPNSDAATTSMLAVGDAFDVLEVTSAYCWGQKGGGGAVGYVARDALQRVNGETI